MAIVCEVVGGGIEPPTHGFSVLLSIRLTGDANTVSECEDRKAHQKAQQLAEWLKSCPLPYEVDDAIEGLIRTGEFGR